MNGITLPANYQKSLEAVAPLVSKAPSSIEDAFGIKRNLVTYMLIPGVCCLATNLVPKGEEYLVYVIALAMIAKCVIGASNAIIPIFTAMQYPTIVRNFGVGIGNLGAGVALILVPYMWLLEHIEPLLPMTIMGICGLIGSVALIMMKDIEQ
uniref:Major facilitator superfamily (MFS) profile domain-containing protein n=1 Tax=Glossina austeni TaxID=7395 RepID=A0A1A9VAY4_GLOAU